jgi:hypothetical protein
MNQEQQRAHLYSLTSTFDVAGLLDHHWFLVQQPSLWSWTVHTIVALIPERVNFSPFAHSSC